MIQKLELSDRVIQYDLERKRVKNINLRIKPDGSVFVSANEAVDVKSINEFMLSKERFIITALCKYEEAKKYAPKSKDFIDGESFTIFGHERRLKVNPANKNYVESDEAYIYLFVKDTGDTELKQKTMNKWLQLKCKDTIKLLCEAIYPAFQKYDVVFPELRFRNMISRWGSCQPKRKIITFNYALINAPVMCIEYVIVHEFVHFLVPNHSRKFYELLSVFLPDWQERKKMLESYGVYIENGFAK